LITPRTLTNYPIYPFVSQMSKPFDMPLKNTRKGHKHNTSWMDHRKPLKYLTTNYSSVSTKSFLAINW